MAYRCNPCRHTSAPFPIARSEWDMKQNAYFCPDCQSDYTLSTNKYPNPPPPKGNCGGCRPLCDYKPKRPLMHMDPCFPPHPAVSPAACMIKPCVGPTPIPPPNHHPMIPPNHPVVPHPVVPHNPIAPPHVTPVPKGGASSLASFFFFE